MDIKLPLLLAFTRHLIRHMVSKDVLILALMAAQQDMKASVSQMQELKRAVLGEHYTHGVFPKEF